jgi:hypothetical protein
MRKQINILTVSLGYLILGSCSAYKTEICNGKIDKLEYQNIYIETERFKGVIFSKDYDPFGLEGSGNKFTPTLSDIDSAELILRYGIKEININRPNQGNGCPVIDKNLRKYKRQYFGYKENGDRIIYINCFFDIDHNRDDIRWKTEERVVLDGCSYFWSVKVNLTKKLLFEFGVNGSA